jgi:hypothetical protein
VEQVAVSDPVSVPPVGDDALAVVPVAVGVLRATARLLDVFAEFFAGVEPAVRVQLGRFVIAGQPDVDATTPAIEAATVLEELAEASDLLHVLAGDGY